MHTHIKATILFAIILLTVFFLLGELSSPPLSTTLDSMPPTTQTAAVADFNSSLIAHYTFDDTTNDSAGSNHGTESGGVSYTTGKLNKASSFDGVDDKITFGAFNIPTSFTISVWISLASNQSRDWSQILGESNSGSGLHFKRGINKISYYFSGGDHLTNVSVGPGQWHHIALVQNAGSYTFYVDGSPDASGTGGVSFNPYIIGHNQWGETFTGLIDDMRIYNRALTQSEVVELYTYTGGSSTPEPPEPETPPTPSTCVSFSYSAWGTCTNGTQTRTVTSSSPAGCVGGSPITTQSCVVAPPPETPPPQSSTNTFYIDSGSTCVSGCNGSSWTNAFKSFSAINWNSIPPGSTLFVAAGTYNETPKIDARGTASAPITIKAAQDSAHRGKALFERGFSAISTQYLIVDGEYQGQRNFVFRSPDVCRNCGIFDISQSTEPRVRYVEITQGGIGLAFTGGRGGEFSYNYIHDIRGDAGMRLNATNGTTPQWDQTRVHHNTIQLNSAMSGDGAGPDGIQGCFGLSVYNNHLYNAQGPLSPDGSNHADLIQGQAAYVKIYNNMFENITDSAIDFDGQGNGGAGVIRIFNNVIRMSYTAGIPSGIRIYSTNGPIQRFDDIHIYNNTFVDQAMASVGGYMIGIGYGGGNPALYNFNIKNNIFYNTGKRNNRAVINTEPSSNAVASDWGVDYNLVHAGAQGDTQMRLDGVWGFVQEHGVSTAPSFISYVQGSLSNNLRLSSSDVSARDRGTNLTSLCSLSGFSELCKDMDGNQRPVSGTWDIGAYEYQGTTTEPPPGNPPPTLYKPGDLNKDGSVNTTDFSLLQSVWNQSNTTYDLTGDGTINTLDYVIMIKNWTG